MTKDKLKKKIIFWLKFKKKIAIAHTDICDCHFFIERKDDKFYVSQDCDFVNNNSDYEKKEYPTFDSAFDGLCKLVCSLNNYVYSDHYNEDESILGCYLD